MKKWLLALACMLLLAVPATAAEKTFKNFTVDVPNGWTANEDGIAVAMYAPGKAAALSIICDNAEGASAERLAKAMSTQLKGTEPTKEGDAYTFEFIAKGNKSQCVLAVHDGVYVLFTITDPQGKFTDQIEKIIDSIK